MSIEKNVVFLFPIASVLLKLKEKLETDSNFTVYEMDSLAEYSQIVGILEYSVTFSTDLRKTSRYLQENKSFVRKNTSRNIVLTSKELSPLAISKLQKFGLNEILEDTTSLRSLEYKVDMFFRPFEQKAKMLEEKKQAASNEMKVLSLNNKSVEKTDEKLRVERMGLMSEGEKNQTNDFQDYNSSLEEDSDADRKSASMSGILGSPFYREQRRTASKKGDKEDHKESANLKRAIFNEVPKELKQKNTKFDLPEPTDSKRKKSNFEEVSSDPYLRGSSSNKNQEIDPRDYGIEFDEQDVDPTEYGLDLDEIDEGAKKRKSIDLDLGLEDRKKQSHYDFSEVQKEVDRKKNKFEEVERDHQRKRGSFEEVETEGERKRKSFEEVDSEKERKKASFQEAPRESDRKKNNFQEVDREHTRKKGDFSELEREGDQKRANMDDSKPSAQKRGHYEEQTKEHERKKGFLDAEKNANDYRGSDKKQTPLDNNKTFEDPEYSGKDFNVTPDDIGIEMNYRGNDETKGNELQYQGSDESNEKKKNKYGKFEEFRPVKKKKKSDFKDSPLSRNWGGGNIDKYASKKREFEKWSQEEKEYYEKEIDYGGFEKVDAHEGRRRKKSKSAQQLLDELIEELLDEPEYIFYEPQTFSLEYLILIQDFYQRPEMISKDIFKFISFALLKSFSAYLSVYIFDEQNIGNEVFCGHKTFKMFDDDQWNEIVDENIEQWEQLTLPTWKDETFQLEINEFLYPLFEEQDHIGFIIAHFKSSISSHADASIAEMLLMSTKGIAYSLYPFGVIK